MYLISLSDSRVKDYGTMIYSRKIQFIDVFFVRMIEVTAIYFSGTVYRLGTTTILCI